MSIHRIEAALSDGASSDGPKVKEFMDSIFISYPFYGKCVTSTVYEGRKYAFALTFYSAYMDNSIFLCTFADILRIIIWRQW